MGEVNVQKTDNAPQRQSPGLENREGPHAMRRGWPGSSIRRSSDMFGANPLAMMRRLTDEIDRAFFGGWSGLSGRGQGDWIPAVDVRERNGELQVHAELPGIDKDNVKVEISEGALHISGERKQEQEEDSEGIHRVERSYGRFFRSIPLPEGVNPEQARAQFNNGVLEISVPVPRSQQQSRQIPIQSGGSAQAGGSAQVKDQTSREQGAQEADPSSLKKQVKSEGAAGQEKSKTG